MAPVRKVAVVEFDPVTVRAEAEQANVGPARHRHRRDQPRLQVGVRISGEALVQRRELVAVGRERLVADVDRDQQCGVDRHHRDRRRMLVVGAAARRGDSSMRWCRRCCVGSRGADAVGGAGCAGSEALEHAAINTGPASHSDRALGRVMIADSTVSTADALVIEAGPSPVVALQEVARIDDGPTGHRLDDLGRSRAIGTRPTRSARPARERPCMPSRDGGDGDARRAVRPSAQPRWGRMPARLRPLRPGA